MSKPTYDEYMAELAFQLNRMTGSVAQQAVHMADSAEATRDRVVASFDSVPAILVPVIEG